MEVRVEKAFTRPGRIVFLVVIAQILIYSISWGQFFCGDSLYYLSRMTPTWDAFAQNLLREDDVGQYRPLTYPAFTYLVYPIGRLEPIAYHWIGLAIHIGLSLLVYLLLRRLIDPGAAILGYLFFALHTTGYFITYDMTFLPDWLLGVFLLLILHCWLSYRSTGRPRFYAIALGLFVLALFSKETALMIPAALFALEMWQGDGPWVARARRTVLNLWPFFALSAAHFIWTVFAKGRLHPEDPLHPFHLTANPLILLRKSKFIPWLLNIDVHRVRTSVDIVYYGLAATQCLLLVMLLVRLYRSGARPGRAFWLLAWASALLLPPLLISEPPYEHHLYMPLVALSAAAGLFFFSAANNLPRLVRFLPRGTHLAAVLSLNLVLTVLTLVYFNERSWVAHGSRVVENALVTMKRHHGVLPTGSVVHLAKSERNSIWYFDRHTLIRLFFDDPTLTMRFEDLGEALPPRDQPLPNNYFVYRLSDGNFERLDDRWKGGTTSLLEWALQGQTTEDRSQFYPDFNRFQTPCGGRVFLHPLIRLGEIRRTLVTIAGTTLRVPLPYIEPGSELHVGISAAFEIGDGFEARLSLEREGRETKLVRHFLNPAHQPGDRGWYDYHLDLADYSGSNYFLVLKCDAGEQKKTPGDWACWSLLNITRQTSAHKGDLVISRTTDIDDY
ncbi:MAG: hypothetical protein EHM23_18950 [Acidobacteria bacterium]|nr:MAG: hypothetical protein EHM23_18950 [Acidobacteriota bacterium]